MTTIQGGRLASGSRRDLHMADGVLVADRLGGPTVDAGGHIVAPGLIDLQINGAFGHDFTQDPTTIWEVGRLLPELGVTGFTPTIVTSPNEVTDLAMDVVANRRPSDYRGAEVLGLHFEGPWISPRMHGAHNPEHIVEPDLLTAQRWASSGLVRMVTLAPELPGATEVGMALAESGVVVSLGHTAADHDIAREALAGYASTVTHLFNQMSPMGHREPGVVGAALTSSSHCLLIADGIHVAAAILEVAWRVLGPERTILATDAMAALGLGPGTYPLGDGPITVGDDGPRTSDGRLAGSVVTLTRAMAHLVASTSAGLDEALLCATRNPARALGLGRRGSLEVGGRADVVVLNEDLDVVATYVGGEQLHG
ncbi:MAG TPA: N-acetylglucosamine-6-phosphate deacetylase [Acidimicrobiia bacterium]|nr:N-acetylglucosamine-6-phosphate deacetylase [Acidimicrobiia bacterium]